MADAPATSMTAIAGGVQFGPTVVSLPPPPPAQAPTSTTMIKNICQTIATVCGFAQNTAGGGLGLTASQANTRGQQALAEAALDGQRTQLAVAQRPEVRDAPGMPRQRFYGRTV